MAARGPRAAGVRRSPTPPLGTDTTADVVMLGGGYTGMWISWSLKEREPGLDVVLLEADICGGGPSGRNGGFTNGWWDNVTDLRSTFGDDGARALLDACGPSPGEIGAWCEDHDVDAWFRKGGNLAVATSPAHEGRWEGTVRSAEALGYGTDRYQVLGAADVAARIRSPRFGVGLFLPEGATVQPARLARGLRRVLLERGVRIFEHTPLTRFGAGRPALAETPGGTVRAAQAVIGLGAWATPWRGLAPYLTVRGSYMVITTPVPDLIERIGWLGGEAVRDLRSSVHYLRTTPDGRIAIGLGGLQPDLARRIDHRYAYDAPMVRRVAADLYRMFPVLDGVPMDAGWGGPINVAGFNLPFFGTLEPGNVHYGLGFTGNGVAPTHLGGKILSRLATGADDDLTRLPVVTREPKRFPPEPIRSAGMLLVNDAIRRKDDAEAAGRRADPFTRALASLPRRLGFNLGPR